MKTKRKLVRQNCGPRISVHDGVRYVGGPVRAIRALEKETVTNLEAAELVCWLFAVAVGLKPNPLIAKRDFRLGDIANLPRRLPARAKEFLEWAKGHRLILNEVLVARNIVEKNMMRLRSETGFGKRRLSIVASLRDECAAMPVTDMEPTAQLKCLDILPDEIGLPLSPRTLRKVRAFAPARIEVLDYQGPFSYAGNRLVRIRLMEDGFSIHGMVATDNTFTADVTLVPGMQTVAVAAKDYSNNTKTQNFRVTVASGSARTLSYDLNGNLLTDGDGKSYTWDAANRLKTITEGLSVTEFIYNGAGQRVQEKINGTIVKQWAWSGSGRIAEERTPSGSVTKYNFQFGEKNNGQSYFFVTDHLRSVREKTDALGSVRARYDYEPYGLAVKLAGDSDSEAGFTGHHFHKNSGLNLTVYRAYDPRLGIWLSRDPIEESGGLNLYSYVFNNPVRFIDIYGRDIWIEGRSRGEAKFHQSISIGNRNGSYRSYSFAVSSNWKAFIPTPWRMGEVYLDTKKGGPQIEVLVTTAEEDAAAIELMDEWLGQKMQYGLTHGNCRTFSREMFDYFKNDRGYGNQNTPH